MQDRLLLIGNLAALTGSSRSALRYYEASGLLRTEARTEAGYRLYGSQAARRLLFIRRAKDLGFKLSEIRLVIDAPRASREDELAYFNLVLASKIADAQARISELRAVERELRRVGSALAAQPPPARCHVGDCACWMPA